MGNLCSCAQGEKGGGNSRQGNQSSSILGATVAYRVERRVIRSTLCRGNMRRISRTQLSLSRKERDPRICVRETLRYVHKVDEHEHNDGNIGNLCRNEDANSRSDIAEHVPNAQSKS